LRLDGNRRRKTEQSLSTSNRRLRNQRASVLADRVGARKKVEDELPVKQSIDNAL